MSLLTAILLAAALTPGQAETPLVWKLKKGDTFYVGARHVLRNGLARGEELVENASGETTQLVPGA